MTNPCRLTVLTLSLCAVMGSVEVARAADQTPDAATTQSGLEEVLVTARFKSESLQSAPIAITAITAEQMEARGYQSIVDVARSAPNVNLEAAGSGFGKSAFVSIRGIGQNDFKFTFEPGVAFYIDDVYFGTVFGSIFDLTDIGSAEILRGPQGTLFGKNTEGGAVRILSKKPIGDGSGYIEADYGSLHREKFKGAFDFALIPDKLLVRISGGSNRSDGYMNVLDFACARPTLAGKLKPVTLLNGCKIGELGGDDVQVARANIRLLATDRLELNVNADLTDDHGQAAPSKLLAIALPPNPAGTAGVPGTQIANAIQNFSRIVTVPLFGVALDSRFLTNSPYTTYATFTDPITGFSAPLTSTVNSWGVAGTMDWDTPVDGVHIKSISAYRRYHGAFAEDTSGAPISGNLPINFVSHRQFSEELQISGRALSNALDWTTGGYYLNSLDFNSGIVDQASNGPGNRGILFLTGDPAGSKDESAFVHVNYQLTSAWSTELGVRYSHETRDYTFYRYEPDLRNIVPTLPPTVPPTSPLFQTNVGAFLTGFAPPPHKDIGISRVDPKVGLSYKWTPDIMTYIQYSTGYKSGGFNPRPLTATQVTSFGPEILTAYEIGLKSEWLDHRLRANVAGFVSNYKDLQLPVSTVDPGTGLPAFLTESVGRARIEGVELELQGRPTQGLSFNASLGYLHYHALDLGGAAYDSVKNPSGPTLADVPALTPAWKGNLGVEYNLPLGRIGTVTPRIDYTYQSKVFNDPQNEPIAEQAGYGIANARLTWDSSQGGWQLSIFVSNLTDKVYYSTIRNLLSTYDVIEGQPGRPREYLFSVRKSF